MTCVLALALQLILWFVPASDRVSLPRFETVAAFPSRSDGWQCGGYRTDDVLILATDWPCLAHLQTTVLHEWGHRVCWRQWGDLSETCAEAYARSLLR